MLKQAYWRMFGLMFGFAAMHIDAVWGVDKQPISLAPAFIEQVEPQEVSLVISDEPYTGYLVPPPTDTEFKFKLAETGDVVTFRWSTLAESERLRVQQLFGMAVEAGRLIWGGRVHAVRLKLKSGKFVAGLNQPDRALPGQRCLRTATKVIQIPSQEVIQEEAIELNESDVYTAKEYYQRVRLARPPSDLEPTGHLELARLCGTIGYYEKGIEHLEFAKVIDPRTEERFQDFRTELLRKYSEQLAERIYLEIVADELGEDFASARQKVDLFLRNFPTSEFRTRVERLRPDIEKGFQAVFSKQIIQMYYYQCDNLLRERMAKRSRLDEKGRVVPIEPGKQIVTNHGRVFKGLLLKDSDGVVVLKMGDLILEIKRKDIQSMVDVDLNDSLVGVDPLFSELKAYVNAPDGLAKDIIRRIGTLLKVDEKIVRDTWKSRFEILATYDDGEIKKTPIYTRVRTASYGKGSWLCEGAQGILLQKFGHVPPAFTHQKPKPEENEYAEYSDDPDVWWKVQANDTKFEILRAMAGQKLFRVKNFECLPCPACGGVGIGATTYSSNGNVHETLCLGCRGLQALFRVSFE